MRSLPSSVDQKSDLIGDAERVRDEVAQCECVLTISDLVVCYICSDSIAMRWQRSLPSP
jgi:recombinational DNA repair protein RecR